MMSNSGGENSGVNDADKEKENDALYEDREPKKIIRIITVTAYMVSVSFVGIVLSAYYIFLWHPPNPRLMHAQAMNAHSEARVDFLVDDGPPTRSLGGLARMASPTLDSGRIDLFAAQHPQIETLKMRREIVKNVNAILRENFEKSRSTEATTSQDVTETMALLDVNRSVVNTGSTDSPDKITDDPTTISESPSSTVSVVEAEQTSGSPATVEESPSTETTLISTSTFSPPRRTKGPSRKQHQTPFALKHLETPIKSDGSKRRPVRFTTTTMMTRKVPVSSETRGNRSMQIPRKMSAHNVMASISRTLGTRHGEGKAANEVKFAGEESKDKLYEPKHKQKLVRVLTVVAYIISVSLAAIVLSLYYMYIWDPSDHPHYVAKQRVNATTTSAPLVGNSAKTPCLDATPPTVVGLTSSSPTSDRLDGTSFDKTTPLPPTTAEFSQSSDSSSPQQSVKSLYKTLTTPASQKDADYSSSTDLSAMPSISSDQFQAVPARANGDDYHDGTIQPVEDLMDD